MWYIANANKEQTFHFHKADITNIDIDILIYIVGLEPPLQEMRGEKLDVAPVIDLLAPYSQKRDSEQLLDLA